MLELIPVSRPINSTKNVNHLFVLHFGSVHSLLSVTLLSSPSAKMSSAPSETCEWADHQVARSMNLAENLFKRLEMTQRATHTKQSSVLLRSDSKVRVIHESTFPASHSRPTVPGRGVWSSWLSKRDPEEESDRQKKIDIARSHRNATRSAQALPTAISPKMMSPLKNLKTAVESVESAVCLQSQSNNKDHSTACSSCIFANQLNRIDQFETVFCKPYKPVERKSEMEVVEESEAFISLSSAEYEDPCGERCDSKSQSRTVEKPTEVAIVRLPPIELLDGSKGINATIGVVLKFPDGHKKLVRVEYEMPDFKTERVRVISKEDGKKSKDVELFADSK
ncbi:hypothetical protein M3Y96_00150200 [Aphelenchoides besseyi]|nr:hypothetical protein M3Y96_00150200 [Aphelenchoides besseyi]